MAHTHEFRFGDSVLFLDDERSVHWGDTRRPAGGTRNVTLYVKSPGEMFVVGRLGALQSRVKLAAKGVVGNISVGVVNLKSITLYDSSIHSYADGVEVATDFVSIFNQQYEQALAAADENAPARR